MVRYVTHLKRGSSTRTSLKCDNKMLKKREKVQKGTSTERGRFTFTDNVKGSQGIWLWGLSGREEVVWGEGWTMPGVNHTLDDNIADNREQRVGGSWWGGGEWVERIRAGSHHIIKLEISIPNTFNSSKYKCYKKFSLAYVPSSSVYLCLCYADICICISIKWDLMYFVG